MTFSQTISNSTQQTSEDDLRRKQLVEALERAQDEVKASRIYVDGLEGQIKSKQQIIEAQSKRQTLSDEAILSLQNEIVTLKTAITEQQKVIETQTAEASYLKKEVDKTKQKLKRSRALTKYVLVAAGALLLTTIFK